MELQEVKERIARRIKALEKQRGKDDGTLTDRDWDMEQERVSAKLDAYVDVLTMLA